jgi:hypothetical protein
MTKNLVDTTAGLFFIFQLNKKSPEISICYISYILFSVNHSTSIFPNKKSNKISIFLFILYFRFCSLT